MGRGAMSRPLAAFLSEVQRRSATDAGRAAIAAWVDGYYGKILQFTTNGSSLHLVATRRGLRLQEGSYPAPDLAIIGEAVEELARQRFDREAVKQVMKQKRVSIRGNLHEAFAFAKFVQEVMKG